VASFPRIGRYFRFYLKKRGERRTGSQQAGSAGLTVFFGGLCALGLMFFIITFTTLAWPEWKVNQQFQLAHCTIQDKTIVDTVDLTGHRPVFQVSVQALEGQRDSADWISWDIAPTYFASDEECHEILDRYERGAQYDCWYDRDNPSRVVLVRGYSTYVWLILLLPGAFILIGGGGVAYLAFGRAMSAERRMDLARRAAEIAPRDVTLSAGHYPSVPHDTGLTNSPGTRLTYRLAAAHLGGWSLASLVAGSLTFCGMVAFVLALAVLKARDGELNLPLLVAIVLFLPAAVCLLYLSLKRLAQAVHLGHTVVEISRQPLYPGAECKVFLAQFGRLLIHRLRLSLVCQEKATFQQGTNTRTEIRQVADHEIFRGEDLIVTSQKPLEVLRPFQVPARAMHSFRSARNEIRWMLVVEAQSERWPAIHRTFPVVVYPSAPEVV
jgi:hypothetical protein